MADRRRCWSREAAVLRARSYRPRPLDSGHSTLVSVRGCDRVVLAEGCGADKWDRDRDAATKTAGLDSAACTSGEVTGRLLWVPSVPSPLGSRMHRSAAPVKRHSIQATASGMRRRELREPASDRGVVRTGETQAPPTLAPGAPRAAQATWLGRRRPWQHGGSSSMAQQCLGSMGPRQHGAAACWSAADRAQVSRAELSVAQRPANRDRKPLQALQDGC